MKRTANEIPIALYIWLFCSQALPQQLPPRCTWEGLEYREIPLVRRRSHYGENDGDGDVTFRCSHFTFRTVTVTVSLPCRERRRGNGCHGDDDGDGSRRCYFGCVRAKKRVMASKGKKPRVKWDSEVERKLIDIWADIIEEFDSKLITRKKKEAIATTRLNVYVSQELNRAEQYTEKEICNKIDTIMKKGKSMYVNYQKKGETGKEYSQGDADLDTEAAVAAWPNFKTFFERFKDHPALGPGSVEDSAVTPSSIVAAEEVVEQEGETHTPSSSRCPSRQSNRSVGGDTDSEEDDDILIPAKNRKRKHHLLPGLARRRASRREPPSSWLHLVSCRNRHR